MLQKVRKHEESSAEFIIQLQKDGRRKKMEDEVLIYGWKSIQR